MSTATRVMKNSGFLYIRMGINLFISLYTTRLLLSSLGASDFGIFNIVGGAIAMLGGFPIVWIVSLLTPKLPKQMVDSVFECYAKKQ